MKEIIKSLNDKQELIVPGNAEETIDYSVKQFIQIGSAAITKKGFFTVALSGGTTPNAIYKKLSTLPYRNQLDWSRVVCFWSDERNVPETDPQSNYHNAMEAGLNKLPLLPEHIFRMKAEGNLEENALAYEKEIIEVIPSNEFDLLMLGMGDDGHTASLFPFTHGLHADKRLVIENFIPDKKTWRMTLTYQCINSAHHICIYVIGANKAQTVKDVLTGGYEPDRFPIQKVGTPHHKATWILDKDAAAKLNIQ